MKVPAAPGVIVLDPDVVRVPDQAPEAVQLSASVEPQIRVVLDPIVMLTGVASRLTVGAGTGVVTTADTVFDTDPPGPVQLRT